VALERAAELFLLFERAYVAVRLLELCLCDVGHLGFVIDPGNVDDVTHLVDAVEDPASVTFTETGARNRHAGLRERRMNTWELVADLPWPIAEHLGEALPVPFQPPKFSGQALEIRVKPWRLLEGVSSHHGAAAVSGNASAEGFDLRARFGVQTEPDSLRDVVDPV
jgi:hypothetical protein